MKISLSHEKLHQLSLCSYFTLSLHTILKLPGNSPTYGTPELIGIMPFAHKEQQTFLHSTLETSSRRAPFTEIPVSGFLLGHS